MVNMSVQSLSASVVNNNAGMRNETRDRMEDLLKSIPGGHSSEYGKKISGFAEFLNDEKVQEAIAQYVSGNGTSDTLYQSMSYEQRVAFGALTQPYRAEQDRLAQERLLDGFITGCVNLKDGSYQSVSEMFGFGKAYGIPPAGLFAGASREASMEFDTAMRNGVEHMQIVDREFKTGVSSVTWEDRFRNVVESLDRAYRGMLGTAPGGSPAAAEITRQYEAKLGELFDYAKARAAAA
jgi:hypothetical protein